MRVAGEEEDVLDPRHPVPERQYPCRFRILFLWTRTFRTGKPPSWLG